MMAEYIEREAAYPLAKKICDAIDSEDFQRLNFGMRILDWIDDLPAADVRPVVRGGWEEHGEPNEYGKYELWYYSCTRCGAVGVPEFNYCPNCGADMREKTVRSLGKCKLYKDCEYRTIWNCCCEDCNLWE